MTSPPPGRDGSGTVAALAVRLDGLRRDVGSLTATVDVLTRTQRDQEIVLDGVTDLRRQVEQILAVLTEEEDAAPASWFWLTMSDEEQDERQDELADWVETVFRAQYPGYLAEQIRPCWPSHPEARWELGWLYQLWSFAYLVKKPTIRDAADWHDRWSPGVIRRLSAVMRRCQAGCVRTLATTPAGSADVP